MFSEFPMSAAYPHRSLTVFNVTGRTYPAVTLDPHFRRIHWKAIRNTKLLNQITRVATHGAIDAKHIYTSTAGMILSKKEFFGIEDIS
jgi:hypothetical protein